MNNYEKRLMTKNGRAIMLLAREMLAYCEGDRIRTVAEYAERCNIARGTVQSAIKYLQEVGATKFESRGHLGTYIVKINYRKLWDVSDYGVIIGVMPLPYSKRYEGLATGFYKTFGKGDIPFSLAFMRGAVKRIEALTLGKYNFAIISKLAAKVEMKKSSNIEIIHEFGEGSYVGDHGIIFRDSKHNKICDGMRVALDSASIDQMILTTNECEGKNVEFIDTPYNQILHKLKNDEVDAAIWNVDEVNINVFKYNICPLTNQKTSGFDKDDTIATIVVSKENMEFANILMKFSEMKEVEEIQHKVINDDMIAIY